jgi:chromosomal replication initiator protein
VDDIVQGVADHFALLASDLRGPRRSRSFVYARHIAMWLLREHTTLSLPEIGAVFGGRDHTTVLYAIRKVEEEKETKPTRDHLNVIRSSTGLSTEHGASTS